VSTGDLQLEGLEPDIVWDMSTFQGWPEQPTYAGIEGARRFLAAWADAWEDWTLELEELVDAGDRVIGIMRQSGRARATGIPVEMRFALVWMFRDGRQVRMQMYADPDEALAAVGSEG
jgi:ketosteroid isomerase-like protein